MSDLVNTSTDTFSRGFSPARGRSGGVHASRCLQTAGRAPESSPAQPKGRGASGRCGVLTVWSNSNFVAPVGGRTMEGLNAHPCHPTASCRGRSGVSR
jgi:hypothetical protein